MKVISIILITIITIFIQSCSCKTCNQKDGFKISVPDSIFKKADKFIISKVGSNFFKENFFKDYIRSKRIKDGYYIRYNYRSLDYEFVDEPVYFVVDTLGNVIKEKGVVGIPDCRYSPEMCDYNVNEEEAIAIAKENRLPAGIRQWDVSFRWQADLNRYIWHVLSTTWEIGNGDNYKARGEEIMIDPVEGSVLKKRKWEIR